MIIKEKIRQACRPCNHPGQAKFESRLFRAQINWRLEVPCPKRLLWKLGFISFVLSLFWLVHIHESTFYTNSIFLLFLSLCLSSRLWSGSLWGAWKKVWILACYMRWSFILKLTFTNKRSDAENVTMAGIVIVAIRKQKSSINIFYGF